MASAARDLHDQLRSMTSASEGSDVETVRRTAALARLSIDDDEARQLGAEFARILGAFRVLGELELEDADETAPDPAPAGAAPAGALRADEPRPSWPREVLLERAPDHTGEFYRVPKTVGGEG